MKAPRVPDLQPFTSLRFVIVDDDDPIFDDIPEGSVASNGRDVFVRASMWPDLEAELRNLPTRH